MPLQELAKEALRRATVASRLDEDLDHVAVLIDSMPEILPLSVDRDKHFVQESRIAEAALPLSQPLRVVRSELSAPAADRLVGDHDSSLGQQILDIPKAQTKSVIEPDCVTDDFTRIAVSVIERSGRCHPQVWQDSGQVDSALGSYNSDL